MKSARETAADILVAVEKNGAYSSFAIVDALGKSEFSDERDKKLVSSLVYCVTEHRLTVDARLSLFLTKPLSKLPPLVLALLRIGAAQLMYFDRIPARAAVNESVGIAKKRGFSYASGMINAVLRRVAAYDAQVADAPTDSISVSEKYSFPEEITSLFVSQFGMEKTEDIFKAFEGKRPVYIRVNTLKTDANGLFEILKEEGVAVRFTSLDNCLEVDDFGDISKLDSFNKGLFHVQDMSSQLCSAVLGAKPGDTVIDCCSAPGGKAFTSAQLMNNTGRLIACDIHRHKTRLIEKTANRLGITCIETVCSDASKLPDVFSGADKVLCDVPCSGFGVIGRKPEIKYKPLSEIAELPVIQRAILERGAALVKNGGRLVYSTCTLNNAENADVCNAFLMSHPEFAISGDAVYKNNAGDDGYVTVLPTENGGDGFFVACFERSKI